MSYYYAPSTATTPSGYLQKASTGPLVPASLILTSHNYSENAYPKPQPPLKSATISSLPSTPSNYGTPSRYSYLGGTSSSSSPLGISPITISSSSKIHREQRKLTDEEMTSASHQRLQSSSESNKKQLEEVEQRQNQMHEFLRRLNAKDTEVESLRGDLELKEQQIRAVLKENKLLHDRCLSFQMKLETGGNNPMTMESQLRQRENELMQLKKESQEELRRKTQEIIQQEQRGHDQTQEIVRLRAQLEMAVVRSKEIEKDIHLIKGTHELKDNDERKRSVELEQRNRQLENRVRDLESEVRIAHVEMNNVRDPLEKKYQTEIKEYKDGLASARHKLSHLHKEFERRLNDMQRESNELVRISVLDERAKWQGEIQSIERDKAEADRRCNDLEAEKSVNLEHVAKLEQALRSRILKVKELETKMRSQDNQELTAALHAELEDKQIGIARLNEELEQRSIRLSQLSELALQRDKEVHQLREEVAARNRQVTDLNGELRTRNRHIEEMTAEVRSRDVSVYEVERLRSDLAELHRRLNHSDDVGTEQGRKLQEYVHAVDERDTLIKTQHSQLEMQRAQIETLLEQKLSLERFPVSNLQKEIASLQASIRERDLKIADLERLVANRTTNASSPGSPRETMLLHELEGETMRYRAEIRAQLEDIKTKNSQISNLEASKKGLVDEVTRLKEQLRNLTKKGAMGTPSKSNGYVIELDDEEQSKKMQIKAKNEAVACMAELASLKQLIRMRLEAREANPNPNLSMSVSHLGSLLSTATHSPFKMENGNIVSANGDTSLSLVQSLSSVKQEIASLRSMLTTQYADHIGNDCNVQ